MYLESNRFALGFKNINVKVPIPKKADRQPKYIHFKMSDAVQTDVFVLVQPRPGKRSQTEPESGSAGLSAAVRTSLDNMRTSLYWGPRSWFWWWGRFLTRMEGSGTSLVNCAGRGGQVRFWSGRRVDKEKKYEFWWSHLFKCIQLFVVLLKFSGLGAVMASKSTN